MLHTFPTPYPNEIFYSLQGRFHYRIGNLSYKETLKELYGSNTVTASLYFPSKLGQLQGRLPLNHYLSTRELIIKHTLYPFFTAFFEQSKADQIWESMVLKDGKDIYNRAGTMAGGIKPPVFLRYCPLCGQEDLKTYGELYWHREHQISGIDFCFTHEVWLNDSTIKVHGTNKHIALIPSADSCRLEAVNPIDSMKLLRLCRSIKDSFESLLSFDRSRITMGLFSKLYRAELTRQGFASLNGRVDQVRLKEAFILKYGEELLEKLQSSLVETNWLELITKKHRKSFHPIRHLLLMDFLGMNLHDLFAQEDLNDKPFGDGLWACLNPFCEHYEKQVIGSIMLSICKKTKKAIGTFSCGCGFSYMKRVDQPNTKRMKTFGQLWIDGLKHMVQTTDKSFRQIARELGVDVNTVRKYTNYIEGNGSATRDNPNSLADIEYHKKTWEETQINNLQFTKTQIRSLIPATYMYLYRHSREWLEAHSPQLQVPQTVDVRVDWGERDENLLREAKRAVEVLLSSEKPIRLSVKSIAEHMGKKALIEKHLDRLPKTKSYIEGVKESDEKFQKRRIKYAIQNLYDEDIPLLPWRIKRKAGLKHTFPDNELDQAVDDFLNKES